MKTKVTPSLSSEQKQNLLNDVVGWIVSGKAKGEVQSLIKANSPIKLNKQDVDELIEKAKSVIEEITKEGPGEVIKKHVAIYEHIYAYFESINHVQGMNKALKAKERLVGVSKGNRVTINQTTIIEKVVSYDTSRLNETEKKRLEYLINKATS